MRELVVSMLHGKTVVLRNLGRRGEALSVLNELITCFQDDENTNIQMVVSDARERRKETINEKE
jgi:predicted RNA-binding protein Jag